MRLADLYRRLRNPSASTDEKIYPLPVPGERPPHFDRPAASNEQPERPAERPPFLGPSGQNLPDDHRVALANVDISARIHSVSSRPLFFGGLSDVYQATWDSPARQTKVALKVIRVGREVSDVIMKRHAREVRLWHRLAHPNLLPLNGLYWGMSDLPAMVSPWYDNGDITRYVKSQAGRAHVEELKGQLLEHVLLGLSYLHNHDPPVVHGDLKGANVLVSDEGVARICDFGFARMLAEHSTSYSEHTSMKGTVRWMAPELLSEDDARHTTHSDVWAFGCLCIEVHSGGHPYFEKPNEQAVIVALSRHELPARPLRLPDWMWRLILDCCLIVPHERASVNVLLVWLGNLRVAQPTLRVLQEAIRIPDLPLIQRTANAVLDALTGGIHSPEPDVAHLVQHQILGSRDWKSLRDERDARLALQLFLRACVFQAQSELTGQPTDLQAVSKLVALALQQIPRPDNIFHERYAPNDIWQLAHQVNAHEPHAAAQLMEMLSSPAVGAPITADANAIIGSNIVLALAWLSDGCRLISSYSCRNWAVRTEGLLERTMRLRTWDVQQHSSEDEEEFSCWTRAVTNSSGHVVPLPGKFLVWTPDAEYAVSFAPDARWSIIRRSDEQSGFHVRNALTGARFILPSQGYGGPEAALCPYGQRVVVGSADGTIWLSEPHVGRTAGRPQRAHDAAVTALAYSTDAAYVASGSADGTIRIWKTDGARFIPAGGPYHARIAVLCLVFSLDGKRLASGDERGCIQLWDATDEWKHF